MQTYTLGNPACNFAPGTLDSVQKPARVLIAASMSLVAVFAMTGCAPDRGPFPVPASSDSDTPVVETPTPTPTPTFNKQLFSVDDPASIWVVVDKLRPLNPQNYAAPDLVSLPVINANPSKLRQEASDALVVMFNAYTAETGLKMASQSAYRSYAAQVSIYNSNVGRLGQVGADLASARGGFSEHQTGLALDIAASPANCTLNQCFADTPQGQWLAANSWQYGWILRYPNGYTDITGYQFEPWHYRYIGVLASTEYHLEGATTLEGFFELPPAVDYAG